MRDRVEAPAALAEPEVARAERSCISRCCLDREVAEEARVVDLLGRQLGDERHETLAEPGEDVAHLLRLHSRLEVVEQRVVGLVDLEARRVLAPQRDVPLEVRPEQLEVVGRPRLDPDRERLGAGARSAPRAARSAPSPPCPGRGARPGSGWPRPSRSRATPRTAAAPRAARRAPPRRAARGRPSRSSRALGADRTARRRHHRLLVPRGETAELGEVPQLAQPVAGARRSAPRSRLHITC